MMIKELAPEFFVVLPDVAMIRDGTLYISMKYRTVNLRCPCGCGGLTTISLHPTRWTLVFDGRHVSVIGPEDSPGSMWNPQLKCGSHYLIRKNRVVPCTTLPQSLRKRYEQMEVARTREYDELFHDNPLSHLLLPHWLRKLWHRWRN